MDLVIIECPDNSLYISVVDGYQGCSGNSRVIYVVLVAMKCKSTAIQRKKGLCILLVSKQQSRGRSL